MKVRTVLCTLAEALAETSAGSNFLCGLSHRRNDLEDDRRRVRKPDFASHCAPVRLS